MSKSRVVPVLSRIARSVASEVRSAATQMATRVASSQSRAGLSTLSRSARTTTSHPATLTSAKQTLQEEFKRSYTTYAHTKPRMTSDEKVVVAIGKVAAATAAAAGIYKMAQRKTEDKPLSGLKLFYVKCLDDKEKRRQAGIVPAEFFHAAKKAINEVRKDAACKWLKNMLLVQPHSDEISMYKEAGDLLFANGQIDDADTAYEYSVDADELVALRKKAGDVLFEVNNVDKAVAYWEKGVDQKDMPACLEKAGNQLLKMNQMDRAIAYFERAEEQGSQSTAMLMQLGHHYLTQDTAKALKKLGKAVLQYDKSAALQDDKNKHAYVLNDLGVAWYMNAITWQQQEKFYEARLNAIQCFVAAVQLNPNDETAARNLEIVKLLNNRPHYGRPHQDLKPVEGKPTFMFDAIMQGLNRNCREANIDFGLGYQGSSATYDAHGNYTGRSGGGFVPTAMIRTQVRQSNESAINQLLALKMQWDVRELHNRTGVSNQLSMR